MGASDWVPSVVGTTASIAVAYLTARGAMKASDGKAAVDRELGSGTLALEVARETRDELKTVRADLAAATEQVAKLTGYQRRTSRWWDRHLPWDLGMQAIATRHDPTAVTALPPLEPFPQWEDDPER